MTQVDPRFYDEILPRLWRGGKHAYFWTNDDGEGQGYSVTTWHTLTGDKIPRLPTKWVRDLNCYFGIHPSETRKDTYHRAKVDDIALANCLYGEVDGLESPELVQSWINWLLDECPLRPSLIVFSGAGLHVYWLLTDTFYIDSDDARRRIILAQRAVVSFLGGDISVNDIARVLRVPGSKNMKPGRDGAIVAIRYWEPDNAYSLEDLEGMIAPQRDAILSAQAEHSDMVYSENEEGKEASDGEILRRIFHAKNGEQYRQLWDGDTSSVDDDHSRADQTLCNALAWATGRRKSQIDRLFRQSALFRDKWARNDYRESTLNNAIRTTHTIYDPQHGISPESIAVAEEAVKQLNALNAIATMPDDENEPEPTPKPPPPNGAIPKGSHPLLKYGHNDEGNAQAFLSIYKGNYRYCSAYDGFLAYNGKYWVVDGADAMIQRAITDMLQRRHDLAQAFDLPTLKAAAKPNANNVRNCQFMLKAILDTSFTLFDASPDHLNCANGVVDLRTGEIEAHSPDQLFTYCVSVDYDPQADYVHWLEFLGSVVSDFEIVEYLQMALGYSITGHTREECMFAIVGATRSGKGTLTETMLKVLPKPLGVEVDFSTFTAKRDVDTQNFDLAALKPARFVAASESKQHETLNEAKVKLATGGNYIRAAFKHKDFFEYKPQFKILLTSNHQIKGDVNDDAFWGRLRIIEFPHSFLGREDKTLKARMQSPESLRGILNWLVRGSMAWYAAPHGLPMPKTIAAKVESVRKDLDQVAQWLDECANIDDPDAWTSNQEIWASFENWAKRLGIKLNYSNMTHLARALSPKGFDTGEKRYINNGLIRQQVRGVMRIKVIV